MKAILLLAIAAFTSPAFAQTLAIVAVTVTGCGTGGKALSC